MNTINVNSAIVALSDVIPLPVLYAILAAYNIDHYATILNIDDDE